MIAIFAGAKGQLRVVGQVRDPQAGGGAGILVLDEKLQRIRQTLIPAPDIANTVVRRTTPEAAHLLGEGDIVVIGYVETAKGTAISRQGWGVRVKPDGAIVWNRTWPQAGPVTLDEYFHFVRRLRSDSLIVGGKSQDGPDTCRDGSSGVALEINPQTGIALGQRRFFKNAGRRQGFRDVAVSPNGDLIFAGWVTQEPVAGKTWCPDDIWVLSASRDYKRVSSHRQGQAGTDVLMSYGGRVRKGTVFAGYTQPEIGRPISAILGLVQDDGSVRRIAAQPQGQPFSLIQAAGPLGATDIVTTIGQAGLGDARGAPSAGVTSAWLRLYEPDLLCGHDILLDAVDPALQVKAFAMAQMSSSDIVVAGQATRAGAVAGGWLRIVRLRQSEADAVLNFGVLSGKGGSLMGVTSQEGNVFTARAAFELAAAGAVSISGKALRSDDLTLLLHDAGGVMVAISDSSGTSGEFMDVELAAGRYTVDVLSREPQSLFSIAIQQKPAAALRWVGDRIGEIEGQPALRKSLLINALRRLGYRTSIDGNIGTGITTAAALEAYERNQCQSQGAATPAERLRSLLRAAGEVTGSAATSARAHWRRLNAAGKAIRKMNIMQDGQVAGEALFSEVIDGRRYGEIRFDGETIYEGEVMINEHSFWLSELMLNDSIMTGAGVRSNADGSTVAALFKNGVALEFGQMRNAKGVVFHGAIRTLITQDVLGQEYKQEFGSTEAANGAPEDYGKIDEIGQGCETTYQLSPFAGVALRCDKGEGRNEHSSATPAGEDEPE